MTLDNCQVLTGNIFRADSLILTYFWAWLQNSFFELWRGKYGYSRYYQCFLPGGTQYW